MSPTPSLNIYLFEGPIVMKVFKTNNNSYLYIKAGKSFFNLPREKLSLGPLAAETGQSRGC
jgi:hypothetical protein